MMKRFELSRFSPLEVSRRVQQCLRFEGARTNNAAVNEPTSSMQESSPKTNLLATIKKKLKKSKQRIGKGLHGENCELNHSRTRKGEKRLVWPFPASILHSHNHPDDNKTDDVSQLIPDDPEQCLCLSPSCSSSLASEPSTPIDAHPPDELPLVEEEEPKPRNLTQELYKLPKNGWYWGPISRSEAEEKLVGQPDGAFLVRDSSDDRYILSLSFRSFGRTLHTRIEHSNGLFSFYSQPEPEGHDSVVELIRQSVCHSQSGVFCYSRGRTPGSPSFPVRLTKPVSRFTQVRSLQYLCRFVIREFTRYDHIQKLPLPERIKGYLEEGYY